MKAAHCWLGIPFGGSTPLSNVIEGGQPAMQQVRRLVDARAAGNY